MTGSRNPCGVWQRRRLSRRGIWVITPFSTTTMVSAVGTATPSASTRCSAATQSAMIRWPTSGRAASWNSTAQLSGLASGPMSRWAPARAWIAAIAARVEPGRVVPPSMTPVSLA